MVSKAADQGLASSQHNLGVIYANGQGVLQNYAEAMKWYRKAADQGLANAQLNLGVMYEEGQGVPQNHAEAVKWLRKAADQGAAGAQEALKLIEPQSSEEGARKLLYGIVGTIALILLISTLAFAHPVAWVLLLVTGIINPAGVLAAYLGTGLLWLWLNSISTGEYNAYFD